MFYLDVRVGHFSAEWTSQIDIDIPDGPRIPDGYSPAEDGNLQKRTDWRDMIFLINPSGISQRHNRAGAKVSIQTIAYTA